MTAAEQNAGSRIVLVVDDSILIRHAVTRFLEEHGFWVESATNGLEALEAVKKFRPDLVITDLNMPKMGGAELIRALQANPETVTIPIVVVAGRKSEAVEELGPRAPFIIFKDMNLESQLERAIASLLHAAH